MESVNPYSSILEKLAQACSRANRRASEVELLAVSKYQSLEKIHELYVQGQRKFGENYVQELLEKSHHPLREKMPELEFQFIGHLQTNKVKTLLPLVTAIHAVDSEKLLSEIQKQAALIQKRVRVYLQVNIDAEPSKGGLSEHALGQLLANPVDQTWVKLAGLMCIPDPNRDSRLAFQRLRSLGQKYLKVLGPALSMGMSDDFEVAIEEGSTCIRIGTALFGERPSH